MGRGNIKIGRLWATGRVKVQESAEGHVGPHESGSAYLQVPVPKSSCYYSNFL